MAILWFYNGFPGCGAGFSLAGKNNFHAVISSRRGEQISAYCKMNLTNMFYQELVCAMLRSLLIGFLATFLLLQAGPALANTLELAGGGAERNERRPDGQTTPSPANATMLTSVADSNNRDAGRQYKCN